MTNTVNLKIDGVSVTVDQGTNILDAAKKLNIHIPTLCYHEDLCVAGNCRICLVEQKSEKNLLLLVLHRLQKVWKFIPIL